MTATTRILDIAFPDQPVAADPALEQERRIAVYDLIESGHFAPVAPDAPLGPWRLACRLWPRRFEIEATGAGGGAMTVEVPLSPLRRPTRHYVELCAEYADAVRHLPADRIEALDEARREAHDEGARTLRDRLAPTVTLDETTARRLFTLICVLVAPPRQAPAAPGRPCP